MEGREALSALAASLRDEESVISPHVREPAPSAVPALGLLAAAGPRAARAGGQYSQLIESIREGYLLHYGEPRVVVGADDDLALLAGDYLYARGLERLAALGDLEAVRELSDLISLVAQLHAEERQGGAELWLASVTAVAAGATGEHENAKSSLRRGDPGAPGALWHGARRTAAAADLADPLERAADSIGFVSR